MFEGLSNIDPNMISYFLGAAGKGMSNPGSFGDTVGSAAMGMAGKKMDESRADKTTKNYVDMIQKALAGGGKVNLAGDKIKVEAPHSAFTPGSLDENTLGPTALGKTIGAAMLGFPGATAGKETPVGPVNTNMPSSIPQGGFDLNSILPFSQGPSVDFLSNADLTGLSPADINNALQLRESIENQPLDRMAKLLNIKQSIAAMQNAEDDNRRQWYAALTKDDRTELKKNYDTYAEEEKAAGRKPKSFAVYTDMQKNDSFNDYIHAVDGGYTGKYDTWLREIKKAGGTVINVGDAVDKAVAIKKALNEVDVLSPDYMAKIEKEATDSMNNLSKSSAKARLANRRKSPQDIKNEHRLEVIKRYTSVLQNLEDSKGNKLAIKMVTDPKSGKVWWYKRGPNGEAIPLRSY